MLFNPKPILMKVSNVATPCKDASLKGYQEKNTIAQRESNPRALDHEVCSLPLGITAVIHVQAIMCPLLY